MNDKHLFFALLGGIILTSHGWFGGDDGDSGSNGGDDSNRSKGSSDGIGDTRGHCGGNGGSVGSAGSGGNEGWFGRKRGTTLREHPFSAFETFDDDKDGLITLEEFLSVRGAGGKKLFNRGDADNNHLLTCWEFSSAVSRFGGKPIC